MARTALVTLTAAGIGAWTLVVGCSGDGDTSGGPADPGNATAPELDGGSATDDGTGTADAAGFEPEIIDVAVEPDGDGTFRFDVTISSPYDGPERYADGWRVLDPQGEELGVRELAHDHAGEQPFTRSLDGVAIPDGVTTVAVEARDLVGGWTGETVEVTVPR